METQREDSRRVRVWMDKLCTKAKAAAYLDLKQEQGWEEHLGREKEGCALNSVVDHCC